MVLAMVKLGQCTVKDRSNTKSMKLACCIANVNIHSTDLALESNAY